MTHFLVRLTTSLNSHGEVVVKREAFDTEPSTPVLSVPGLISRHVHVISRDDGEVFRAVVEVVDETGSVAASEELAAQIVGIVMDAVSEAVQRAAGYREIMRAPLV